MLNIFFLLLIKDRVCLENKKRTTTQMKEQTRNTEVQINEEEIGKNLE